MISAINYMKVETSAMTSDLMFRYKSIMIAISGNYILHFVVRAATVT